MTSNEIGRMRDMTISNKVSDEDSKYISFNRNTQKLKSMQCFGFLYTYYEMVAAGPAGKKIYARGRLSAGRKYVLGGGRGWSAGIKICAPPNIFFYQQTTAVSVCILNKCTPTQMPMTSTSLVTFKIFMFNFILHVRPASFNLRTIGLLQGI